MTMTSTVHWGEERAGTFTVRTAAIGPYRLSVLSDGGTWHWLVALDDDHLAEGGERSLEAAKAAAEAAARQLPPF